MTEHNDAIYQELESLEAEYRRAFPNAAQFDTFCFGPEQLLEILRNANGREIVFSYPGLADGVVDGGEYSYKEVVRNPLTLQELLYARGLPKDRVKLVRHRDTSGSIDRHEQYRTDRQAFLAYQQEQGKKQGKKGVFDDCDYVVSFLGEENRRARFVGVYRVAGVERETAEHLYYNLIEEPGYEALKERVVVRLNGAPINWHQWFDPNLPVSVLEIQHKPFPKTFKSYLDFTLSFAELQELVKNQEPHDEWRRMLSAVSGVYLILDTSTGQHYVGSAYGKEGGVWGRWAEYVATNGHGGNVGLRSLTDIDPTHARHFQFTLLMTLNRTTERKEVLDWESIFKKKISPGLCRN